MEDKTQSEEAMKRSREDHSRGITFRCSDCVAILMILGLGLLVSCSHFRSSCISKDAAVRIARDFLAAEGRGDAVKHYEAIVVNDADLFSANEREEFRPKDDTWIVIFSPRGSSSPGMNCTVLVHKETGLCTYMPGI